MPKKVFEPKHSSTLAEVIRSKAFTSGADPEAFIIRGDERIGLAEQELKPIRASRRKIQYHGAFKVDSAAIEFNPRHSGCLQSLVYNISKCVNAFFSNSPDPKVNLSVGPVVAFNPEVLEKAKDANRFGCSPSYCATPDGDAQVVVPFVEPFATPFRSVGYHTHLGSSGGMGYNGYSSVTGNEARRFLKGTEFQIRLAQACDLMVGIPAMLLDHDVRNNRIRREIIGYGRAGEFRAQKHGFEYRALPAWPLSNPTWAWWAHAATRDAAALLFSGYDIVSEFDMSEVADVMNSYNLVEASKIWKRVRQYTTKFDGRIALGNNASFSLHNVIAFEFLASRKGYKSILNNKGVRNHWKHRGVFFPGFPNYVTKTISVKEDFQKFKRAWNPAHNKLARTMRLRQEKYA